jgi:hypothetical protein
MNSAFPVIELIFGRLRLYWGYWIFAIITLELYLGLAYLVHTVDHTWGMYFIGYWLCISRH